MERLSSYPSETGESLPFVLSMAAVDATAGAGLLSDIKTLECQGVYGLGILTGNTIQTDNCFREVHWVDEAFVFRSLESLQSRFEVRAVKIGVVPSRAYLLALLNKVKIYWPGAKIVWDPVLRASAGGRFLALEPTDLDGSRKDSWCQVLKRCTVVTPNAIEAAFLCRLLGFGKLIKEPICFSGIDPGLRQLSNYTSLILKGGHLADQALVDRLYYKDCALNEMQMFVSHHFSGRKNRVFEKHGSGCIHSSVVAASLAKGDSLQVAMNKAKVYMEQFLASSKGLLGTHNTLRGS